MRIFMPSTLTSQTGSGVCAGPLFTSPVVRSNRDPCQGHSTTWPAHCPWASGPPICVQLFRIAEYLPMMFAKQMAWPLYCTIFILSTCISDVAATRVNSSVILDGPQVLLVVLKFY